MSVVSYLDLLKGIRKIQSTVEFAWASAGAYRTTSAVMTPKLANKVCKVIEGIEGDLSEPAEAEIQLAGFRPKGREVIWFRFSDDDELLIAKVSPDARAAVGAAKLSRRYMATLRESLLVSMASDETKTEHVLLALGPCLDDDPVGG
jgi:hypothetical protein